MLQVDATAINRLVDMGPAADSAEAAGFREFWGSKSELRRFQATLLPTRSPIDLWMSANVL